MSNVYSKVTKAWVFTCVVAALLIVSGCQSMFDASVRDRLGYQSSPPDISSSTSDPELQVYLTLWKSLENDLLGVTKEMSPEEQKIYLKKHEEFVRNMYKQPMEDLSAAKRLAMAEKAIDEARPPYYLSTRPMGVSEKETQASISITPDDEAENIDNKYTVIVISYKFSSFQEMSAKAQALRYRFRTVFSTKDGWKDKFAELLDAYKNDQRMKANRESFLAMEKAGDYWINYTWGSDLHFQKGILGKLQIANMADIRITTSWDGQNGQNCPCGLSVTMSRHVSQLRTK